MKKLKNPAWGGRGNGFAWWLVILLFVAVFLAVQLAEGAVIAAVALLTFFFDRLPDSLPMLTALFSTVPGTAVVLLFCRFAEGRRPHDLGLSPRRAGREYLAGLPIGLLLFAGAVGICAAVGAVRVTKSAGDTSAPLLLLFFAGYLLQGMSEEVLCRGFFMGSLLRRCPIPVAVTVNSAAFALLHLGNNGVTPLALGNIFLFGVLASLYVLRRGNLWGACAIHSMWNFAQGNLFGAAVSGNRSGPSLLRAEAVTGGSASLWNGGAFGPEGGLAVTLVLLAGIAVLLFLIPNAKGGADQAF